MKCIFHAANTWSSKCGKSTVGPALLTRVDRRPEEKTMKLRPPPRPKFLSLSIHGINEKISVQAYETQVKFIFEFIQNGDTDMEPVPHLHEL